MTMKSSSNWSFDCMACHRTGNGKDLMEMRTDMPGSTKPTHGHGGIRIKLPVAPVRNHMLRANMEAVINMSDRHFGNRQKAGGASAISPEDALIWLNEFSESEPEISAVELSGPGDALASLSFTIETLRHISVWNPEVPREISTIGVGGTQCAVALVDAGARGVNIELNSTEPRTLSRMYAWIRPAHCTLPLSEASELLAATQMESVKAFSRVGLRVNIRTILFIGINDAEIEMLAEKASVAGASSMELFLLGNSDMTQPPASEVREKMRELCTAISPILSVADCSDMETIEACTRDIGSADGGQHGGMPLPYPSSAHRNVAVASLSGVDVDLHLGQAGHFLIYGPRKDGLVSLLGVRHVPFEPGSMGRWEALVEDVLYDCFCVVAEDAGHVPCRVLGECGIRVLKWKEGIEDIVDALYGGGRKKRGLK